MRDFFFLIIVPDRSAPLQHIKYFYYLPEKIILQTPIVVSLCGRAWCFLRQLGAVWIWYLCFICQHVEWTHFTN